MRSNGESWDLCKLFKVVKEKGGYDAVCENRLWDLVGKEYGLGVNVGSSVELVYTKHFSALEECLKSVADGKFPECGSVDDRDRVEFCKRLMQAQAESLSNDYGEEETGDESDKVCDSLDGGKLCGTNMVEGLNSVSNGTEKDHQSHGLIIDLDMTDAPISGNPCIFNAARDTLEVFDQNKIVTVDAFDAESNMPTLSDGSKSCDNDNDNNSDEVLILDPSDIDQESFGRKRKRDSMLEMLSWVTSIAKNPCDHAVGSMREKSKWKSYGSQDIWKQILLFREAAFLTVDASDAESNLPKLSDGSQSCDNDNDNNSDEVLILDPSDVDQESFGRERKRESKSEMLSWVTSIAKNPCDPAAGSMPEMSKWKSYGSQEIWMQTLLFREAAFLKKGFETVSKQLSWQGQKVHPSMYDGPDSCGTLYNLRQRLKRNDKKPLLEKSTSDQVLHIPVGPNHQAQVPEWSFVTYESDSKWLGTQIWPPETLKSKQLIFERDPVGKGRQDSCGCQVQGSVECVRFHISMKRSRVKLELGEAFYQWNLHKVGEEVRGSWTQQEEKKFKDVVKSKSNPPSLDKCYWDYLFKTFPKKSREDLVSYYFNVFLLQHRAYQNRHTPDNTDSDDDGSEFTPLKKVFGDQTQNSRSFTLLSPKKATNKGK